MLLHPRQGRRANCPASSARAGSGSPAASRARPAPPRRRACPAAPPSRPAAWHGRRCRSGCRHWRPLAGARRSTASSRGIATCSNNTSWLPEARSPRWSQLRHHADAGGAARHQEEAGARRFVVGAGPHGQPGQALDAGGVELVAVEPPFAAFAPCHGGRQAAARGRAQRRLHAQGVDQRALAHHLRAARGRADAPASGCRCGRSHAAAASPWRGSAPSPARPTPRPRARAAPPPARRRRRPARAARPDRSGRAPATR